MTPEQALRFAAYAAAICRDKDAAEELCLLFPPMLRVLDLEPMEDAEARAFRFELKQRLIEGRIAEAANELRQRLQRQAPR